MRSPLFSRRGGAPSEVRRRLGWAVLAIAALLVVFVASTAYRTWTLAPNAILGCKPIGSAHPICGFQNPEDLVLLPDGHHVVVSEYGGIDHARPGVLSLLDLRSDTRRVLFRGLDARGAGPWGDARCPGAPGEEFSPHGIHLGQRADGAKQLLVVQHGGRESVEFFEVNDGSDGWSLSWRGCVVAPDGSSWNDVVASPDGGFFVTHMMTRRTSVVGQMYEFVLASVFGTGGHVAVWDPQAGFRQQAGSAGPMPNGIESSPDGEYLYVGYSVGGEIRRIHRASGRIEAHAKLPPLDNVSWAPDGRLLVAASRASSGEMMACARVRAGACPAAFAIVAVSPQSLEAEVLYEGGPGTPGGAGTVALRLHDGGLLIGTFAGDRVVRVGPRSVASVPDGSAESEANDGLRRAARP